ncbi:PRC-barrel domain-containing protein [Acuticoccus sp.]|uniref:PRC-barrel domain-containing protein n=1 Tax=Acuticoccus sp. TaxID=1904378 RepID=UPI003B52D98D
MADINVSHSNIRASRVNGTTVYNTAGEQLGTVEDVVIGKRDGKVKYAIMSFGGFLGIGEEYHPLPWDTLDYDTQKDGYTVSVTREQLEGGPRYDTSNEPDWEDEAYHRSLYSHYGLTYPAI